MTDAAKKKMARKKKPKAGRAKAPALGAEAVQTRERILEAAEREFARKGFDGARVDEIARAAGVNKALIYYYFESKEALLDQLVDRVLGQIVQEKETILASAETHDLASDSQMSELARRSIEITKKRMPIFGILCTEAFKSDEHTPALFRVMDRYMASMLPPFERAGFAARVEELRLPGVFFGLAPLFFFYLLRDKWADYYNVDGKELEERFLGYFIRIYGDAIRPLLVQGGRGEHGGSSPGPRGS